MTPIHLATRRAGDRRRLSRSIAAMVRPAVVLMALVAGCGADDVPVVPVPPPLPPVQAPAPPPAAPVVDPATAVRTACNELVRCADFNAGRPRPTVDGARECLERWIAPCEDALTHVAADSPDAQLRRTLVCERRATLDALTSVPGIARRLRLDSDRPLDVEEWAHEDRSREARAAAAAFARCFGREDEVED